MPAFFFGAVSVGGQAEHLSGSVEALLQFVKGPPVVDLEHGVQRPLGYGEDGVAKPH
jgi:hypothetical protein